MLKYIDLTTNVINPNALIKEASQFAQDKADSDLTEASKIEKQAADEKSDSLSERSTAAINRTKDILKEAGEKVNEKEPVAEKKDTDDSKKTAVSAVIKLQMQSEAVNDKIADELTGSKIDMNFNLPDAKFKQSDIKALNEKVASAGKYDYLKTASIARKGIGLLGASAIGAAGAGAGFFGGRTLGKKDLRKYVAADAKRDVVVNRQAFNTGQLVALAKIKRALSLRNRGAVNE